MMTDLPQSANEQHRRRRQGFLNVVRWPPAINIIAPSSTNTGVTCSSVHKDATIFEESPKTSGPRPVARSTPQLTSLSPINQQTMAPLNVGDKFPEGVKFGWVPIVDDDPTICGRPQDYDASEEWKGKKVVIV